MQDLWSEIEHDRRELVKATAELRDMGVAKARAEAAYQAKKHSTAFRLRAQGVPATLISLAVKGHPDVVDLMLERDIAEADWDAQKELINTLKKSLAVNEAQMEREWSLCR